MSKAALRSRLEAARAVVPNPFRQARTWLCIAAIALGVALGTAVFLINQSAVSEFSQAVRQIAGNADLVIIGAKSGFDEALYPRLAQLPEVAVASPALELDVRLAARHEESLKILGVDPLRAAAIRPDLFPANGNAVADLFAPGTLLINEAAALRLGLKRGDTLSLSVGVTPLPFRIVDVVPERGVQQPLALMDIANAQWQLRRMGQLNRIDLRLRPGVDIAALQQRLAQQLPPGVRADTPDLEAQASANPSRAYRVNLTILALVALFTGAFLVFSTQALSVLQRRSQLALLRVLGLPRRTLLTLLLCEGALIGAIGAAAGIALGERVANFVLQRTGADLGAGYFPGVAPVLQHDPWTFAGFFFLGIAVAALGALVPALEAVRAPPAPALRAGAQEQALTKLGKPWLGVGLYLTSIAALLLPPWNGLPMGGYLAIVLILFGSILLLPALARAALSPIRPPPAPAAQLALCQLKNAPGRLSVSLSAMFLSFSLMVAMAIMVYSFRHSVADWLAQVLPADLYVRAAQGGDLAYLDEAAQAKIASAAGVSEVDFVRVRHIQLDSTQPPVTLIARSVARLMQRKALPLVAPAQAAQDGGPPPAWISEAARDLYGFRPGMRVRLPIDGRTVEFIVAGIWRDYARQFGAILIDRDVYTRITGDRNVNDAAIFLARGADQPQVEAALRLALADAIEIAVPAQIRAASLKIFDRSFYVTYALEAVAVLIGLFGVSSSFSAQVLARRSEFGMLRHVGMTARQIAVMLGLEGALLGTLGMLIGMAGGFVLSLILIRVINPQSFNWSMDLHLPWAWLMLLALVLVGACTLTAAASARQATRFDALRAVRDDG